MKQWNWRWRVLHPCTFLFLSWWHSLQLIVCVSRSIIHCILPISVILGQYFGKNGISLSVSQSIYPFIYPSSLYVGVCRKQLDPNWLQLWYLLLPWVRRGSNMADLRECDSYFHSSMLEYRQILFISMHLVFMFWGINFSVMNKINQTVDNFIMLNFNCDSVAIWPFLDTHRKPKCSWNFWVCSIIILSRGIFVQKYIKLKIF